MVSKRERFGSWRGGKNASKEQQFMEIVCLVESYIGSVDIDRIKQDLQAGQPVSDEYVELQKTVNTSKGILLHLVLELDEHVDNLSSAHKDIVVALRSNLGRLYEDYTDQPKQRIEDVIQGYQALLAMDKKCFVDKQQAKRLLLVSYFALGSGLLRVKNLPIAIKWLIRPFGFDLRTMITSLDTILQTIEKKIMALDEIGDDRVLDDDILSLDGDEEAATGAEEVMQNGVVQSEDRALPSPANPPAIPAEALLPLPHSIEQEIQFYLNEYYFSWLMNGSIAALSFASLAKRITEIRHAFGILIDANQQRTRLQNDIEQINSLLQALNSNQERSWGRKYFRDLIAEKQDAFDLLMRLSKDSPEKQALLADRKRLHDGSRAAQVLYAASWLTAPVTTLVRATVSQETQNRMNHYLPNTADGEAKALLKTLAEEQIALLQAELTRANHSRDAGIAIVADGNANFTQLLQQVSVAELQHLVRSNTLEVNEPTPLAPGRLFNGMNGAASATAASRAQEFFQQKYLAVLNSPESEKSKCASLASIMVRDTNNLKGLMVQVQQREKLLITLDINRRTIANLGEGEIRSVLQKYIGTLESNLAQVELLIRGIADALWPDQEVGASLLLSMNEHDLQSLITANIVEEEVPSALLSLVVPAKMAESEETELTAEDSMQSYFNSKHLALFEGELDEEDNENERLQAVVDSMQSFNQLLSELIDWKKQQESVALRIREMQTMIFSVNLQTSPLLHHLVHQRYQRLMATQEELANSVRRSFPLIEKKQGDSLRAASVKRLQEIVTAHQKSIECIQCYQNLHKTIALYQNLTKHAHNLDQYAKEKYTWWVVLTDFLARFIPILKSSSREMIDNATGLKQELIGYQTKCRQQIASQVEKVRSDSNFGVQLLDQMASEFLDLQTTPGTIVEPVADSTRIQSALQEASLFRPRKAVGFDGDEINDSAYVFAT